MNELKKWGWDYDRYMTKGSALRDIVFSVLPFVLSFLFFGGDGVDPLLTVLVGYAGASVLAGFLFVRHMNVFYQQGCILGILWLVASPVIGIFYLPVMFFKALRKMFS